MAIIVSPVWSSIRGSIAGTTYFTLNSGAIIGRQRVKPVNPGSPNQTQVRSAFAGAVAVWEGMTQANRDSWDAWAQTIAEYRNGRQAFIAGYTLALYMNNRFAAGITLSTTVPSAGNIVQIASVLVTAPLGPAVTGIGVSLINYESEAVNVLLDVSAPFNPTRNFWKGPYVPSLTTAYTAAGGGATTLHDVTGLIDGQKYFVRVRAVMDDDPLRVSSVWRSSGLAETVV